MDPPSRARTDEPPHTDEWTIVNEPAPIPGVKALPVPGRVFSRLRVNVALR